MAYESGIKHMGMLVIAYTVYLMALGEKPSGRKKWICGVLLSVLGASMAFLFQLVAPLHYTVLLLAFLFVTGALFKERIKKNLPYTVLSFAFSYAFYYLSVAGMVFSMGGLSYLTAAKYGGAIKAMEHYSFLTSEHPVGKVMMAAIIFLVQCVIAQLVFRTRRMRKGLATLFRFGISEFGMFLSSSVLVLMMFFCVLSQLLKKSDRKIDLTTVCFFVTLFCIIMLYFWLKKELRTTYKIKMMENGLTLLEKSLKEKDELVERLHRDNDNLAEMIHTDNKLIPSIVSNVRQVAKELTDGGEVSGEIASALQAADSLDEIYASRHHALEEYEAHRSCLPSTGVAAVDAVLLYMQSRASSSGVEFKAYVETALPQMLEQAVGRMEFNTVLADLSENAIISAKGREDGVVAVRIGQDGGRYFLAVSDNGKQFDVDVLRSMGKKRVTTHQDEGGSGIGLMTLFRILRHTGASFVIEELQCGETAGKYTKNLCVIFDGAGILRIVTDRADELKKALRLRRFEIVRNNSR